MQWGSPSNGKAARFLSVSAASRAEDRELLLTGELTAVDFALHVSRRHSSALFTRRKEQDQSQCQSLLAPR